HSRLRRVRVRGEQRERPAVLAGRTPLHRGVHQVLARLLRLGLLLRVHPGEVARVRVAEDRDAHVRLLDGPAGGGRDPLELLVARQLVEGRRGALGRELHDREAAGAQHLLVHRLGERLSRGGRLDHARLALLQLRGVANEDLGERLGALVLHACCLTWSTSQAWTRSSPVSSGWKATARMFPCLTATGCPSTSASTSTSSPHSSTHGARMNTARRGPGLPRPLTSRSASKLCTCRPNALRRAATSRRPR